MNDLQSARRRAHPRSSLALAALLVATLLALATTASGERTQRGHLVVSIGGGITPLALPRHHPVPVALRIGGAIATDDGSPLPRLTEIRLAIAGRGVLDTDGLPVCPRARLRNTDSHQALARCRSALVGRGTIAADVFIPHQKPFPIHSALLAFNGRNRHGATAIWVHAFSASPPLSIVLPFIVVRNGRHLSTVLRARVPPALGDLPHLSRFQISLSRRFGLRGARHSYLSASCPAPAGFSAGFLTIAKASYRFADGRTLRIGAVRSCRAR
jgi:hypothetical protein